MSYRKISRVWFALIVVTVMFLCPGWKSSCTAEDRPAKITIGYQRIPNAELIAKDLGWQEKALGVPIQWVEYDSGLHVMKAMQEGKVDIGLAGSSPAAAGIARGIPAQVIWIHDLIGENEALVVKKTSNITKMSELAGKRIAAPFGSTTHYHLMVALKLNHMKPSDIAYLPMEPDAMLKAWKDGQIDGGYVWEPTLSKLRQNGGRTLITSRDLVKRGFPTADLCVMSKTFGERYPSLVVRYVKTLDRAVRLYREKPREAAAAVARQLDISTDEAARQMKGLILLTAKEQDEGKFFGGIYWNFGLYTVLKDTADFLRQQHVVKSLPPRSVFIRAVNASFLVRAMEQ